MKNKTKVITILPNLTHFSGTLGLPFDYMSNADESIGSSYTSLLKKITWLMTDFQNTSVMLCPENAVAHARHEVLQNPTESHNRKIRETHTSISATSRLSSSGAN